MTRGATQRLRDQLVIATAILALAYLGRAVLIPLAYSLLTAMVLYPFVARLERRGISKAAAIALALIAVSTLFGAIGYLLLWEMSLFLKELPALSANTHVGLDTLQVWVMSVFDLSEDQAALWSAGMLDRLPNDLGTLALRSADAVFGMVFNLFIIPVFTALILYDRRSLVRTLVAIVGPEIGTRMPVILQRTLSRFASFITGMIKVYAIVGVLNSIGLLLLGVPNAILFGMLTAIMTIIPYVGIIVSALLPISISWMSTGDIWVPLGVVAVFAIVQYLEANLIFPKVVGGELGLNTLASIVIVLIGALIWGVSGMVLLMPIVSVLLLISEDIPGWRALGLLLGKSK